MTERSESPLGLCVCGEPIIERETGEAIRDLARDVLAASVSETCAAGHVSQAFVEFPRARPLDSKRADRLGSALE